MELYKLYHLKAIHENVGSDFKDCIRFAIHHRIFHAKGVDITY